MKTAISVPDPVYEAAEKLAHQMGVSRSEFYITAIASFIKAHQEDQITTQLNQVYTTEESALDSVLVQIQALSLPREDW
jgi:metal-responsive CopG/Arc/MetJ family transcriptional regulator